MSGPCRTCALAQWELTPKGNPRKSEPGECTWTPPDIGPFPLAMPYFRDAMQRLSNHAMGIWIYDDEDCPCHLAKGEQS
jgi:hypothetical protein